MSPCTIPRSMATTFTGSASKELVHNASAGPCDDTKPRSLGTEPVTVSWWKTRIQRAKGITANIDRADAPRTDLPDPPWWTTFKAVNSGQKWEKGHLLASRFGGPDQLYNFAPQYRRTNRGPFETCENRIADAIEKAGGCGCVMFRLEVNYADNRKVVPNSFRFVAKGKRWPDD